MHFSTLPAIVCVLLVAPLRNAPQISPSPGTKTTAILPSPVPPEQLRDAISLALLGRRATDDDAAFELMPQPALTPRAPVTGWSKEEIALDYVPVDYERVVAPAGARPIFADSPPEVSALFDSPDAEFGFSTGVLASPLGAVVLRGATISFIDPQRGRVRYLVPFSAFSGRDSVDSAIPQLVAEGRLDTSVSPFLPQIHAGLPSPDAPLSRKPSAVSCTLMTGACVGLVSALVIGCAAACGSFTPLCIACIIGGAAVPYICCKACNCWRSRGVSISCSC